MGDQPHAPAASTLGKDPVSIVQEAVLGPGPIWTGRRSRPHRNSMPDRPARIQSLFLLSYPTHPQIFVIAQIVMGTAVTVVKVLCYKLEVRWFDASWCQWICH